MSFADTGLREQARQSVQAELARLMPATDTSEIMRRICESVREVDQEIDRILRDPLVSEAWEYDGKCFVARRGYFGLHVAFDGLSILEWLEKNLAWFFRSNSADVGMALLMKEMDTFLWLAKVRRMNWEEEGHLGVLGREVIRAVLDDVQERRRLAAQSDVQPLSDGERAFFRFYEEEMNAAQLAGGFESPDVRNCLR